MQLKTRFGKQASFFMKKRRENEGNTHASHEVLKCIAEKMKPFTDDELVKECLLAVVDIVCPENKSLFASISLSGRCQHKRSKRT